MPQVQRQLDPQALKRLLADYVTVSGRKLGAAGRETLEWLVTEAGFRRTIVRLAGNPFGVDPRSMRERIDRLAGDGAIQIYKPHKGCRGGIELKVRDLFAIHDYRLAELNRDKWLLQFESDDEERCTIRIDGLNAGVSVQKPPHSTLFDPENEAPNAGVTAPKASHSVDPGTVNAGVSAQKPTHSDAWLAPGAPPELAAAIAAAFHADQLDVWLTPIRFEIGQTTQAYLSSAFCVDWVRKNLGRDISAAVTAAGFPDVEFAVDPSLANARVSAQKPPHSEPIKVINSIKPLKGLIGINSHQANQPQPLGDFGEHPLLLAADVLYTRNGTDWPFRWYAIQAATLAAEGAVPPAAIEAGIKSLLPNGIKSLAGQRWRKLADFKRHLRDRYGIAWQEHFAANRKASTERNPS